MVDRSLPPDRARSPLVGLFILAVLPAGRLVGRILGVSGDLAVVEVLDESDITGPGLVLLKLGGVALPEGGCRLFRSRDELLEALHVPGVGLAHGRARRRSTPRLVAIDSRPPDA